MHGPKQFFIFFERRSKANCEVRFFFKRNNNNHHNNKHTPSSPKKKKILISRDVDTHVFVISLCFFFTLMNVNCKGVFYIKF